MSAASYLTLAVLIAGVGTASGAGLGPTIPTCRVTWSDTFSDFTSFNIYIATTAGGPYTKVGTWPGSASTTYGPSTNMCGGLADGQKFLVVRAVNLAGTEGPVSNEFPFVLLAAVPGAPSNVQVGP